MRRLEMNANDQAIAESCHPAHRRRSLIVWDNPNTRESWLVALVIAQEVGRFLEALASQGCVVVVANGEQGSWDSIEWLRHHRKDAPLADICRNAVALGTTNVTARLTAALSRPGAPA